MKHRIAALGLALAACSPEPPPMNPAPAPVAPPPVARPTAFDHRPIRAIWVTRWDYRSEDDVVLAIEHCASAGFDTVLFQVRGSANAFYRSSLEPWAEELGGRDPGFDPLAVAIREARARGLALHAWVNVMPAWWGDIPPADPAHLYHTRPEWMWYDQDGRRQPLVDRFYVSLNPCLPEVRRYLVTVLGEIAANYAIDGLHLDYVRFPNEPPVIPSGSGLDYPRDARTLELYRAATGRSPDDDPAAWSAWRAEQVTELVRGIRGTLRAVRPSAALSAAVGSIPESALTHHFQDGERWMREGLLDAIFPMNYSASAATFDQRLGVWRELAAIAPACPVVAGLRLDLGTELDHAAQVLSALALCDGFAFFGYSLLFDSPGDALAPPAPGASEQRAARREHWLPRLAGLRSSSH